MRAPLEPITWRGRLPNIPGRPGRPEHRRQAGKGGKGADAGGYLWSKETAAYRFASEEEARKFLRGFEG